MVVKFLEPGAFIRLFDRAKKQFVYYMLLEIEAPLKYPYTFSQLSPQAESVPMVFD